MTTSRVGTDCSGIEAPIQALKNLGIKYSHEFSSELDKYVIKSIKANYNPKIIYGDMTTRNHSELPDIDLYVCGFPCQSFSLAGSKRGLDDPRGKIFFHCVATIKAKQPKYFVLENVKGLLTLQGGEIFREMLKIFDKSLRNYKIYWKILNTKDYGIPQNRERLFIVGIRESKTPFVWPDPLQLTERELERKLIECIDFSDTCAVPIPTTRRELFERIPNNSKFINMCFSKASFIASGIVSPCLTTSGSWCVPLHRYANVKEYLALQGFPTDFKQVVSDTQLKKQIGNSISVCILEKIFQNLLKSQI